MACLLCTALSVLHRSIDFVQAPPDDQQACLKLPLQITAPSSLLLNLIASKHLCMWTQLIPLLAQVNLSTIPASPSDTQGGSRDGDALCKP